MFPGSCFEGVLWWIPTPWFATWGLCDFLGASVRARGTALMMEGSALIMAVDFDVFGQL